MKILEKTPIERTYNVLATFILPFTDGLRQSPESEQQLGRKSPRLEHAAWAQSKKYYHINHRCCAAASKLHFTTIFLHSRHRYWAMMPAHDVKARAGTSSITIRMFDREDFHYHTGGLMRISRLYCVCQLFTGRELETSFELASRSNEQMIAMRLRPLLKTIKQVWILSAPTTSTVHQEAFKSTQYLNVVVEQTWKECDVEDGR